MNLEKFNAEPSVEAIYKWWEKKGAEEKSRTYLGASIIGHDCDRYLWYAFRQCAKEDFGGRMLRLFDRGRLEEGRFIEELRGIGCTVEDRNDSGEQIGVNSLGGHFRGHLDAMILGLPEAPKSWHVGEFKTHNDSSYNKLLKSGVKVAKPMHFAQMQVYMGLTDVDRAYYLAANKDTDELYSERLHFDKDVFARIMARAKRIITSVQPCERVASRPDDWRCKMCAANKLCWGCAESVCPVPQINCRSCCHATPEMGGESGAWSCSLKLPMMGGCESHLLLPGLIACANDCVANKDGSSITYTTQDGKSFTNGVNGFKSRDLAAMSVEMAASGVLAATLAMFDGNILEVNLAVPLVERYPPGDSRMLWEGKPSEIEEAIANLAVANLAVTDRYESDSVVAVEYAHKFLLSVYTNDDYAVLWQGVE